MKAPSGEGCGASDVGEEENQDDQPIDGEGGGRGRGREWRAKDVPMPLQEASH